VTRGSVQRRGGRVIGRKGTRHGRYRGTRTLFIEQARVEDGFVPLVVSRGVAAPVAGSVAQSAGSRV